MEQAHRGLRPSLRLATWPGPAWEGRRRPAASPTPPPTGGAPDSPLPASTSRPSARACRIAVPPCLLKAARSSTRARLAVSRPRCRRRRRRRRAVAAPSSPPPRLAAAWRGGGPRSLRCLPKDANEEPSMSVAQVLRLSPLPLPARGPRGMPSLQRRGCPRRSRLRDLRCRRCHPPPRRRRGRRRRRPRGRSATPTLSARPPSRCRDEGAAAAMPQSPPGHRQEQAGQEEEEAEE